MDARQNLFKQKQTKKLLKQNSRTTKFGVIESLAEIYFLFFLNSLLRLLRVCGWSRGPAMLPSMLYYS